MSEDIPTDNAPAIEEYPKRIYVNGMAVTVKDKEEEARYRTSAVTLPTPKVAPSHKPVAPHPYAKKPDHTVTKKK